MPRPIRATVHTAALAGNLGVVRRLEPAAKIWAVVKANAYGHGLARALAGLRETDGFALLDFDEAVRLREYGWAGPILLLEGIFTPADLEIVERYNLTATVHCAEQLRMIESARLAKPIAVHLKMNSGMNRLGFAPARFRAAWERARASAAIGQITLMTHFSDADGDRGIAHQISAFETAAADIPGGRSLSNSAAVLWHRGLRQDWVRPGIMLYGASPSGQTADIRHTGLAPAMTLSSELIGTQTLEAGETCGYGSTFTAPRRMTVGTVACGYADGYPRHAPSGTPVIVDGVRTRLLGRVSMDMLAVDLEPCLHAGRQQRSGEGGAAGSRGAAQVGVGTAVELWGKQLPIDEVAAAAGTLGYELMCAVAPRVPMRAD
ncbi:MAG: alanine racemase [Janthinobacterium lividum]